MLMMMMMMLMMMMMMVVMMMMLMMMMMMLMMMMLMMMLMMMMLMMMMLMMMMLMVMMMMMMMMMMMKQHPSSLFSPGMFFQSGNPLLRSHRLHQSFHLCAFCLHRRRRRAPFSRACAESLGLCISCCIPVPCRRMVSEIDKEWD